MIIINESRNRIIASVILVCLVYYAKEISGFGTGRFFLCFCFLKIKWFNFKKR